MKLTTLTLLCLGLSSINDISINAKDSITIDQESILDEIEKQGQDIHFKDGKTHKWMTSSNSGNLLDQSGLEWWQNTFVRFKGYYEGLYKGFYRNSAMEYAQPID